MQPRYYLLNPDNSVTPEEDVLVWARAFEHANRCVALTVLRYRGTPLSRMDISTVFLGLDHRHEDGPPLLFETMVFGGPLDQKMARYSTHDEALAGHDRMVKRCQVISIYRYLAWAVRSKLKKGWRRLSSVLRKGLRLLYSLRR